MNDRREYIGVLLAAGRSKRMGRPKQLLPWPSATHGPDTVITAAFECIQPVCDHMIVVVGHEAERIIQTLSNRTFQTARADPEAPMFESIKTGLACAQSINAHAAVVLHPADHPAVRHETVQSLLECSKQHPDHAIMPEYNKRGGHPVIIPPNLFEMIDTFTGEGGLRALWHNHPDTHQRLPCNDPGTTTDLDTQTQYHRHTQP